MAQSPPDPGVRRYREFALSYERYLSGVGELNREFVDPLETYREKYGGGACHEPRHDPIAEPATVTVAGMSPEGALDVRTASVDEGDAVVVDAGDAPFRVKVFGQRREEPASERLSARPVVGVSIDAWDGSADRWEEVAGHLETGDVLDWAHGERSVRVVLVGAPELDAAEALEALVGAGLSPAEALDYWMVERRDRTQTDWARVRGASQQAVSKNVRSARNRLE